jgi:hypothetical protein
MLDGAAVNEANDGSFVPAVEGALSARVTATNSEGSDSLESSAVAITLAPAVNTVAPVIIGNSKIGSEHTTSNGTWTNGNSDFTYQWNRDGSPIGGATGAAYTAVEADDGAALTCTVTEQPGDLEATSAGVDISYAAPVATSGTWTESKDTGDQTYDGSALFTVAGDSDLSSVTIYALSGTRVDDGVFASGVFESAVFTTGGGGNYLNIDATTGEVTLDTDASGLLDGVTFDVVATNAGGTATATVTLTVSVGGATSITAGATKFTVTSLATWPGSTVTVGSEKLIVEAA